MMWYNREKTSEVVPISRRELDVLRPIDDVFMKQMFEGDARFTEQVLRLIIGVPSLEVKSVSTQKALEMRAVNARSVILDVYATDGEGVTISKYRGATKEPCPKGRGTTSARST